MKQCEACGGSGHEVIGENYVTEDMASDAGEPAMAGMFHSWVYGPCSVCDGSGEMVDDAEPKLEA